MRISDWSSDVCSSDLRLLRHGDPGDPGRAVLDGGAEGLDRGSAVRDPRGLTRRGADRAPDSGALSMQTQLRISGSCDLIASTSPGTASAPTGTVALEPAKSSPIGSARPSRQVARKPSVTALKAVLV